MSSATSSAGNSPSPWGPYDSYKDCSQGICSIYCPQWCYIIFPPPPPPLSFEDDSGTDFSPLIIAVIGILASAFILVSYYTIISKCCRRPRHDETGLEFSENHDRINIEAWQLGANVGLDEALIKSITVFKYKKGNGLVEGTDCSVCLSEFLEDESLRLLPKCNHAFHLPCIDTWLKSHSSCPLCRANIPSANTLPAQTSASVQENEPETNLTAHQYQHRNDAVLVIQDIENRVDEEAIVGLVVNDHDVPKTPYVQDLDNIVEVGVQPMSMRRSVSLNSSLCQGPVLVADFLSTSQEEDEDEDEDGFQLQSRMEKNSRSRVINLVKNSPLALKRSVSTGRFMMFTRYGSNSKVGNSASIPN